MLRQVVGKNLRARRKRDRLSDAKQKPHREQHREAAHKSRDRRGKRPQEIPRRDHVSDFEAVYQPSADKLHRSIAVKKHAQQNSEPRGREAQFFLNHRCGNREVSAIDIVYENADC